MNMNEQPRKPAIVFSRERVNGADLEKKELWRASMRGVEGRQLVAALRRPFMNYKECKEQLEALLAGSGLRIRSPEAFKGTRTFYLPEKGDEKAVWLTRCTEPETDLKGEKERRKMERIRAHALHRDFTRP